MHPYSAFLGPVDNAFYYVERPETPMNIGALVLYEGCISFEALKRLIDHRVHRAPRYQQRVIQAPFNLGQPTWTFDPDFHINRHVHHVRLPAAATQTDLHEVVSRLLSCPLERDKPLWEVYLIEGLANQTAVFYKVHHCMVDGLAAVEIFTLLMDLSSDESDGETKPVYDAPPLPHPLRLTWDTWQRELPHRFGLLRRLGQESTLLGSLLFDPDRRLKTLVAMAHLVSNNLKPIKKLPINGKNSGQQSLVWAEFPLEEIHQIRRRAEASVNDVMLALLTATIARYSQRFAARDQSFVRILMPVNIRSDEERGDYGNRISVLPVDIPLHEMPLERLASVKQFTTVMKESMLSLTLDMVLTLPSLMPSVVQPSIWGTAPALFSLLAHTWCTNVAAMPEPVYLLGHEMQHVFGYFPLNPSMGLASVVVSYNGRMTMTLVIDRKIVIDEAGLQEDLNDSYLELREAAGVRAVAEAVEICPERLASPAEDTPELNAAVSNHHHHSASVKAVDAAVPVLETTTAAAGVHVTQNGSSHVPPMTLQAATPVRRELPSEPAAPPYRLFSDEWAQALKTAINESRAYHEAATNWTSGALAFVINADPAHGYPVPAAVALDLHRGVCRSAQALPVNEAMQQAAFVIAGDYAVWMEVLRRRVSPLAMLTTGRLKLRRGSLFALLPHTRSANELVRCACGVPYA